MIAWLAGLPLKLKAYAIGAAALLATFALFWFRWKLADARADKAEQEASALKGARKVELSIQRSRAKLREKQAKVRAEIAGRTERDAFENQGWGP